MRSAAFGQNAPAFLAARCSQIFPVSVWRAVSIPSYTVPDSFSMAATGAAVANGWSAGRRWALRHWASAAESGSPWQQGPAVARGGADAPSRAFRKTPEAPPGTPSPVGETEKRDRRYQEPKERGRQSVG